MSRSPPAVLAIGDPTQFYVAVNFPVDPSSVTLPTGISVVDPVTIGQPLLGVFA